MSTKKIVALFLLVALANAATAASFIRSMQDHLHGSPTYDEMVYDEEMRCTRILRRRLPATRPAIVGREPRDNKYNLQNDLVETRTMSKYEKYFKQRLNKKTKQELLNQIRERAGAFYLSILPDNLEKLSKKLLVHIIMNGLRANNNWCPCEKFKLNDTQINEYFSCPNCGVCTESKKTRNKCRNWHLSTRGKCTMTQSTQYPCSDCKAAADFDLWKMNANAACECLERLVSFWGLPLLLGKWNQFVETDKSIVVTEGGKTIESTGGTSARAGPWISSSGSAFGTVKLLNSTWMNVGIISRCEQTDMRLFIGTPRKSFTAPRSWWYDSYGEIKTVKGGVKSTLQGGLPRLKKDAAVTVVLQDGWLSFKVNGKPQGSPIDIKKELPEYAQMAMIVTLGSPPFKDGKSLGGGAMVRLSSDGSSDGFLKDAEDTMSCRRSSRHNVNVTGKIQAMTKND